MESGPSIFNAKGKGNKTEKTRRTWSVREEEALIEALKTAVHRGFRSENGFRCGYLSFLETELAKAFSGSNIRANPHIVSKIHVWKKTHGSLMSMLSRSGIGWNDTDKVIEASNEAWEEFVKSDNNARLMRNKSWPFFNDWCEIFGNDRAAGSYVEPFAAAVQDVLNINTDVSTDVEYVATDFFNVTEGAGESISVSQSPLSNATSNRKGDSKKRKKNVESDDGIVNAINNLADITKSTMSDLVKQLGTDEKIAALLDNAFDALGHMTEINMDDKVFVAELMVDNPSKLGLFLRLPHEGRLSLIRRPLQKD
ncbi:uncharacterized protein [Henckelia pumila]|uniref:uncharacterized protein n=1 Tax=Henckelia pumila TaxID=405737 RepID=UPI003C6DFFAC